MAHKKIVFIPRILRKQADLPRYVVINPEFVQGYTKSFSADVHLDGVGPFRRNVHPWGKGSNVFFINLTGPQCNKAGLDTGDECQVTIIPLRS